jgi:predicted membrane protein
MWWAIWNASESESSGPSWNQVIMLVGVSAALVFAIGYTIRPLEEIHDDRHDSDTESDSD